LASRAGEGRGECEERSEASPIDMEGSVLRITKRHILHRALRSCSSARLQKTGINSTLGIALKTEDFVRQVAISDVFEIQSSRIAQERGNADQKAFAGTMIKDHQVTSADLMDHAGEWKTALPTKLDSLHQSKIDKLKSLHGAGSAPDTILTRSAATKMPFRCLNGTRKAATTRTSRNGQKRRCRPCGIISKWPRRWRPESLLKALDADHRTCEGGRSQGSGINAGPAPRQKFMPGIRDRAHLLGRQTQEEVAQAIVWLLSDASSQVTHRYSRCGR
jgi:predicted outer membrane protein